MLPTIYQAQFNACSVPLLVINHSIQYCLLSSCGSSFYSFHGMGFSSSCSSIVPGYTSHQNLEGELVKLLPVANSSICQYGTFLLKLLAVPGIGMKTGVLYSCSGYQLTRFLATVARSWKCWVITLITLYHGEFLIEGVAGVIILDTVGYTAGAPSSMINLLDWLHQYSLASLTVTSVVSCHPTPHLWHHQVSNTIERKDFIDYSSSKPTLWYYRNAVERAVTPEMTWQDIILNWQDWEK